MKPTINELKAELALALSAEKSGDGAATDKISKLVDAIHDMSQKTGDGGPHVHKFSLEEHEKHKGTKHEGCEHCIAESAPLTKDNGQSTLSVGGGPETKGDGLIASKGPEKVGVKPGDPREPASEHTHAMPPDSLTAMSLAIQAALKPVTESVAALSSRISSIEGRDKSEDLNKKFDLFKKYATEKLGIGHANLGQMLSLYEAVADNATAVDNLRKTIDTMAANAAPAADGSDSQQFSLGGFMDRPIGKVNAAGTFAAGDGKGDAYKYLNANKQQIRMAVAKNNGGLPSEDALKLAQALSVGT